MSFTFNWSSNFGFTYQEPASPFDKIMSDIEVYKTIQNLQYFPDLSTIEKFTEFSKEHGLQIPALFLANTILAFCYDLVFQGQQLDANDHFFKNFYLPLYRRTFVWTLRCELERLHSATDGGRPGSVGEASSLAKRTLDSLYDLYQAEGALFEEVALRNYSTQPQDVIVNFFSKLDDDPVWSQHQHQVKLRCYMIHYMHLNYYSEFTGEPKIDRNLYISSARITRSEQFIKNIVELLFR